jgi:hypothetical protein
LTLFRILCPGAAAVVQEKQNVVQHFGRGSLKLDGGDPLVFEKVQRDHEVLVNVRPLGGHLEGPIHLYDKVRLAKLPAIREFRRGRSLQRIALRRTCFYPPIEQSNPRIRQAPRIAEVTVSGFGLPWRHVAFLHDSQHRLRAFAYVGVFHKRERCDLTWPVARSAVVEDERRDVLGERNIVGLRFVGE